MPKRPRLRGYPPELKAAADHFARDIGPGGGSQRAIKLLHELGYDDWYLVYRVVVRGVTASQLETEDGAHNKAHTSRIRRALTAVAAFYGIETPANPILRAAEKLIADRRAEWARREQAQKH